MTPKPTADRQTVEALRGVLRQIADNALLELNREPSIDDFRRFRKLAAEIQDFARRALAATEPK